MSFDLDVPPFNVLEVAAIFRLCGHEVRARAAAEPGMADALTCAHCQAVVEDPDLCGREMLAEIRGVLGECPGKLYRPIPGTPWFDYARDRARARAITWLQWNALTPEQQQARLARGGDTMGNPCPICGSMDRWEPSECGGGFHLLLPDTRRSNAR